MFLYHIVAPCDLAVWWDQHTELLFYSLKESTKGNQVYNIRRVLQGALSLWCPAIFHCLPSSTVISGAAVPHRVYPQASIIVSSVVSADRSLLAVGLQSGVVLIWDQRTGYSVYTLSIQE